jgi:type VI protein secretion system component Hcp
LEWVKIRKTLVVVSVLALILALSMVAWFASVGIPNPAFSGTTNGANQQTPSTSAYDMFLKIQGIPGESVDDAHKDWIGILSMSAGIGRPSSMGGPEYSKIVILKELDKSSPKLYEALNTGLVIASVEIEMVNPNNKTATMRIVLEDVMVSSIETGLSIFKEWGSASPIIYKAVDVSSPSLDKSSPMPINPPLAFGHDARYIEEVSLTYQAIHWNYTYSDAGGHAYSVTSGWDLVQNKVD